MKYTGESCFYCRRKFEDKDDVVVCPKCGTPYHRSCYKEAGGCVNERLHETGESWKSELPAEKKEPETGKVCPSCRHINPESAVNCENCGSPLQSGSMPDDDDAGMDSGPFGSPFPGMDTDKQYFGFNPDEDMGGAKLKEVAQFVDSNTIYYLPLFKRMKDTGSKISFNFVSLLFPYFYFANRKMWFWGILAAAVSTIMAIPEFLYIFAASAEQFPMFADAAKVLSANEGLLLSISDICGMFSWALRIVICLFANNLYFRFSVDKVNRIKAESGGYATPQQLRMRGGVNPVNIILMGLILMGMTMGMSFLVMAVLFMI